jgi:choline dehydrogenase-like flavoprotein
LAAHEKTQDIVIGSGPAGVAAASALIDQGRKVTMLDVGEEIEPERAATRSRMADVEPDQWSKTDIATIQGPRHTERTEGMRPFGSDFLLRDPVDFFEPDGPPPWFGLRPSFALGGLSNGWGAAVLPYRAEDIQDWPLGSEDLAPHYNALGSLIPIAAEPDALADLFPMQTIDFRRSLPLCSQADRLYSRLEGRRESLREMGVYFGRARQAVADGCRRCAMCLHGCPYGLIFNAADAVARLSKDKGLSYKPGRYVTRFQEQSDGVRLWSRDLITGQTIEEFGDRVFVAGGVLPTAHLVLNSLSRVGQAITLRDSQQFMVPMVQTWWPRPDPAEEPRNTLTQLFVEIIDPSVTAHTVHVQLYGYNDLYAIDMRHRFGLLARAMGPLIGHLSRRLIVAQGFLHSDASPEIEISLIQAGGETRLDFTARENSTTDATIARAQRKLFMVARAAGLLPLSFLGQKGALGSSYHCGGTFPMRKEPVGLETDRLGRPTGLRRVFLVDASVFPSIPATTITLSVMANAHRIATCATGDGLT